MARLVQDWVEGFLTYSVGLKSPEIYRRWAALCGLAGCLQRRVWIYVEGQRQRANLYVLLVGPPATGKSNALKTVSGEFLVHLQALHLSPTDVTREAFYEILEGSVGTYREDGEPQQQCSLTGFLDEWAVFVHARDEPFMTFLADVYDNPTKRDYVTKTKGKNAIEYPNFTMAGGVTMKQLKDRFTDQALEGGFPSRIIMVYSDKKIVVPTGLRRQSDSIESTRTNTKERIELRKQLIHDLERVMLLEGEYIWENAAADEVDTWVKAKMAPVPTDPRLNYYSERRMAHFTKLCMILAASRRDELIVTLGDAKDARETLLEAERWMPHAISALGANDYFDQLKLGHAIVIAHHKRTGKPCPEWKLRQGLASEIPIYLCGPLIESLVKMRWIDQAGDPVTSPQYVPGRPQDGS